MIRTVAGLVLAAPLVLGGCVSSGALNTTADTNTAVAGTTAAAVAPAHVGDAVAVKSNSTQLRVTLVKIAATTKATDQISTPGRGKRYTAVQLRIVNTGSGVFTDAIDNDVTVADAQGQQFEVDFVGSIAAGQLFPGQIHLAPGGKVLGWVAFAVPKAAAVRQVQFVAESGFGDGAQWRVP